MIVNLGCGRKPLPDAINVDMVAMPHVDVVHDVDVFPWPFADATAERIYATHLFEHVADPLGFMAEAHRVLAPAGTLHLEVPYWQSRNAYTDPTHRRYCTEETFRYWVPGNWLSDLGGEIYNRGCLYDEVENAVVGHDLRVTLRKR